MSDVSPLELTYITLGGVLPALLWLSFWLREDALSPEPRRLLYLSFILGMLAVPLAMPLEKFARTLSGNLYIVIILWAFIEEMLKLLAGYVGGIRSTSDDEPIDAMIYLITAALGFAALENTLYILNTFVLGDNTYVSLLTGNSRFIGATLLHVLCSGTIGIFLAFTFFKKRIPKGVGLLIGVILATALHTLFNLFIIKSDTHDPTIPFSFVWLGIIILILIFEKVKKIKSI